MGGAFGRLEVVADYEWEAFHQVDVRRDWLIRDILLVNREPVFRATGMERLDITADSRSHMHYLVKLEPAQSEGPGMVPTAASTEVDAIEAVVREWHREEGWGVVDSPQTPGGCWVHFSHIQSAGYRELGPGRTVTLEFEPADQDGFSDRAVTVMPR